MDSGNHEFSLESTARVSAWQIHGKTLTEIFSDGPRRTFVEWPVPKHGTYRLHISRPFGPRKPAGLRWRIQITVQYEGQAIEQPVNDGHITVPLERLGDVIIGAAEQMAEHIRANKQTMHQIRRAAMQAVQAPGVVEVGA